MVDVGEWLVWVDGWCGWMVGGWMVDVGEWLV